MKCISINTSSRVCLGFKIDTKSLWTLTLTWSTACKRHFCWCELNNLGRSSLLAGGLFGNLKVSNPDFLNKLIFHWLYAKRILIISSTWPSSHFHNLAVPTGLILRIYTNWEMRLQKNISWERMKGCVFCFEVLRNPRRSLWLVLRPRVRNVTQPMVGYNANNLMQSFIARPMCMYTVLKSCLPVLDWYGFWLLL